MGEGNQELVHDDVLAWRVYVQRKLMEMEQRIEKLHRRLDLFAAMILREEK